jgi:hypothetical protein
MILCAEVTIADSGPALDKFEATKSYEQRQAAIPAMLEANERLGGAERIRTAA